jgi:predicted nucleic acid-binding protein
VEQNPTYFARVQKIFQWIDEGTSVGITSVLTLTEVLVQPLKLGKPQIAQSYQQILLNSRNFHVVSIDAAIAQIAADLRARYNLRTPDALQIGAALEQHCDAFLTNDRGLQRVMEIRVLVVDELEL